MPKTGPCLVLAALLTLTACGADEPLAPATSSHLEGVGWNGGVGFDPDGASDRVRVIAFFNPVCAGCVAEARRLVEAQKKHADLEVVGATEEKDLDMIKDFRATTGARYPVLIGVSEETKKHYGVLGYPTLVVLGKDGSVAGHGEDALEAALTAAGTK